MMTTEERERVTRDCADIVEDATEELEYLDHVLDEDFAEAIGLEWPPNLAAAHAHVVQLELALGEAAEKLSRLARELSAESFSRNYPQARALGNGGLHEPGRRSQ